MGIRINAIALETWLRLFQFALDHPVGMCIVVETQFWNTFFIVEDKHQQNTVMLCYNKCNYKHDEALKVNLSSFCQKVHHTMFGILEFCPWIIRHFFINLNYWNMTQNTYKKRFKCCWFIGFTFTYTKLHRISDRNYILLL